MTEQGSGLRFDIYERVHLPEGLDGIEELEEAELVPHIQVVEEEDYAVIKGNLWLSGAYRGDSGAPGQTLEHLIPVEITMPQNRISRLEDVRVEIDQFDVELLSNRSLNVTGVLSLHGLEMLPYSGGADEKALSEETVFIYDIPAVEPDFYAAVRSEELPAAKEEEVSEAAEPAKTEKAEKEEQAENVEKAAKGKENEENVGFEGTEVNPEVQELEEPDNLYPVIVKPEATSTKSPSSENKPEATSGSYPYPAAGIVEEQAVPLFHGASNKAENDSDLDDRQDIQEIKVAFSPKTELSHLHSLVRPAANRLPEGESAEVPFKSAESVEWKKLFIRESEGNAFKKIRICIVQKEETIEEIAERYRLSAREIAFYNQLGGQQVGEGQVLIIPS
ncbi:LysM peptidoglycan-binding domain-containing protein [Gorillibacterium timonense]|uniref:LysM peptidoglycan-binding domain-containing protein n=1 Tax=Gorillibacterium timonense TaxID=1689269 RepID=UPI00071DAC2B|nr:LysM peptidoglycan-binding domain-containing protein [Gorillibacterium timonense]